MVMKYLKVFENDSNITKKKSELKDIFYKYCKIGLGNITFENKRNNLYDNIFDIILRVKFTNNIDNWNYNDYKEFLDFLIKHSIKFNIKNETLTCYFIDADRFISDIERDEKANKYNI